METGPLGNYPQPWVHFYCHDCWGTFLFQLADRFTAGLSGWMSWADGWIGGVVAVLGTFSIAALGYFFSG